MKFAETSFNRKSMAYDPKVTPFNDNAKRHSFEPRRLVDLSPNRKIPTLNSKKILTA